MSEKRPTAPQHYEAPTPPGLPLVVGVDIGGTQIRTGVLRGATLLSRVNLLTGEHPAPDKVIPRIVAAIHQAVIWARTSLTQIAGIGIAMPGPLNNRTGVVYEPPNLAGWQNVPLRDMVTQQFNVPVIVENDANAAGLGEYLFGAGQGSKEMIYLTISTGIGGGIITDGRIVEGASGSAGELGYYSRTSTGESLYNGSRGPAFEKLLFRCQSAIEGVSRPKCGCSISKLYPLSRQGRKTDHQRNTSFLLRADS